MASHRASETAHEVLSFNVLSSSLSPCENYPKALPEDCDPDTRLNRLFSLLDSYVEKGRAIICMQEVSRDWHGKMIPYFRSHGYTLVASLYGYRKNGFMGVAIAYPDQYYDVVRADAHCVADHADWPSEPSNQSQLAPVSTWSAWTGYLAQYFMRPPVIAPSSPSKDDIIEAKSKSNTVLMLHLCPIGGIHLDADGSQTRVHRDRRGIVVGTYHMPCAYHLPRLMVLHAVALVTQFSEFADGLPRVLAGDFNMQPGSDAYNAVTTGKISDEMEDDFRRLYPSLPETAFRLSEPMRSMYAASRGEPKFTCYVTSCYNGKLNEFIGTIDYLFASDAIESIVSNTLPDSPIAPFGESLPCKLIPSDHLPLGATFTIQGAPRSHVITLD